MGVRPYDLLFARKFIEARTPGGNAVPTYLHCVSFSRLGVINFDSRIADIDDPASIDHVLQRAKKFHKTVEVSNDESGPGGPSDMSC